MEVSVILLIPVGIVMLWLVAAVFRARARDINEPLDEHLDITAQETDDIETVIVTLSDDSDEQLTVSVSRETSDSSVKNVPPPLNMIKPPYLYNPDDLSIMYHNNGDETVSRETSTSSIFDNLV